jgi:hypothetical protein
MQAGFPTLLQHIGIDSILSYTRFTRLSDPLYSPGSQPASGYYVSWIMHPDSLPDDTTSS